MTADCQQVGAIGLNRQAGSVSLPSLLRSVNDYFPHGLIQF